VLLTDASMCCRRAVPAALHHRPDARLSGDRLSPNSTAHRQRAPRIAKLDRHRSARARCQRGGKRLGAIRRPSVLAREKGEDVTKFRDIANFIRKETVGIGQPVLECTP
jgi:hypothetical protein